MTQSNFAPGEENQPVPQKKRRRRRTTPGRVLGAIAKLIGTLLLVGVTTGVLLVGFAAVYINTVIIPEAKQQDYMGDMSLSLTSRMYYTDENGVDQEYLTLSSDENRIWVKYADMPKNLINATVAIEDKRFWKHNGVDWLRTGRGVLNLFTGGSIQGGSTITQQFIKNKTGNDEVTVKRKIMEIFRALEFEKNHSKPQILEWYLNFIFLGERCYGVGSASYAYFGKDVRELSLAQCASLVGITNNPSRYDPYLNKSAEVTNDAANRKRAKLVLQLMLEEGMITQKEHDAARREVETMKFVRGSAEGGEPATVYNWYQDQVITDVINDLMEKYQWSKEIATHKLYYGGLSIFTDVDLRVQAIVDEVYSNPESLPYVSNSGQPLQSSIVVVDNRGRVVALSGGIGEKTKNRAWSRASTTKRPPGSSIKPLAVYSQAMEMGYITPYTVLDDAPYQMLDGKPWPVNSSKTYRGLIPVYEAVARSINTIAVRTLGDYVTPQNSYNFLQDRYHISSLVWEKWINNKKFSDMGLAPLALGGLTNGVSPYEMAAAYATFPSMGRYVPPRTYSKVIDSDGVTVLLDHTDDSEYVIKEKTAYYVNTVLQKVVSGEGGTGGSAAFPGMTIAGKTGTTTNNKDIWFVGYTPYYTAAVWVGYDRQEQLSGTGRPHTLMWNKVMSKIHEGLENKSFPEPSDGTLVTADYCRDSGLRPNEYCALDIRGSRVATGTYVQGDEPKGTCQLHTAIQVCTGAPVVNSETGELTGWFHPAGEFCPGELVQTVSVIDYVREGVAAMVGTWDGNATLAAYTGQGVCPVHLSEGGKPEFDPEDPATWPTDDPLFHIEDPATWPSTSTTAPGTGDTPGGEGGVSTPPDPPPEQGETPPPEGLEPPVTVPEPDAPPSIEDEPFVPAETPAD